ncbi:hypothetical protein K488DRAFT_80422 [Vararia minispora EC-137]|uniref:Uncharacterized protein n=1 Tax=Vararia minispora EC-137 TaxID=1314806 RepID=A0ACB8QAW3_9AGAM|nr:hypothetical protein K488DRAFT_80422 [Vararia minispora EC-137]
MLPVPPPAYHSDGRQSSQSDIPPPPFTSYRHPAPQLSSLPPHLLLHVVYHTFPQRPDIDQGTVQRQRKTLYWLAMSLRLVSRSFYIACMHVLRSSYLPAYSSLLRHPYSSDPFPLASSTPSDVSVERILPSLQRETTVLDLFIAVKVREDVWADDSELHLEREESFRDLFDLMQPRARVEDLVRVQGERAGVIASPGTHVQLGQLDFGALGATFSLRRVGLVLTAQGGKRTIVETDRARDEPLEQAAHRLVKRLAGWLKG